MIIQEIILNNFTSYYGKHVLRLKEGVNYICGSCGSGRTNLARAFQFAVLGYCDLPRTSLFNHFHKEDMRAKRNIALCEVKVKLLYQGRIYVCKSSMRLDNEGRIRQNTSISAGIDETITSREIRFIYLDILNIRYREEDSNESGSTKIWNAVLEYLAENMRLNIRLAILDQVMYHFDYLTTERMQNCISRLPFDQIIVIDNGPRESQDKNPHNIVLVEEHNLRSTIRYPQNYKESKLKPNKPKVSKLLIDNYVSFEDSPKFLECEIQKVDKTIAEFYARMLKTQLIINKYYAQNDSVRANLYCCNIAEKSAILKTTVKAHLLMSETVNLLVSSIVRCRLSINLPISLELLRQAKKLIHCLLPEVENQIEKVEKTIENKIDEFVEYYSLINRQKVESIVEKTLEKINRTADEQIEIKFPIRIKS